MSFFASSNRISSERLPVNNLEKQLGNHKMDYFRI
jgi:hypothetical protein